MSNTYSTTLPTITVQRAVSQVFEECPDATYQDATAILTSSEEWRFWLTALPGEALQLQRLLPDCMLSIVGGSAHEDPA